MLCSKPLLLGSGYKELGIAHCRQLERQRDGWLLLNLASNPFKPMDA